MISESKWHFFSIAEHLAILWRRPWRSFAYSSKFISRNEACGRGLEVELLVLPWALVTAAYVFFVFFNPADGAGPFSMLFLAGTVSNSLDGVRRSYST